MRLTVLAASLLIAGSAAAADMVPVRMITVTGQTERKVVPDQAHVNVNVSGLEPKVDAAKASHDKKLKDVIAIAKANGIDEAQIRTQHSSMQPQYTYENNKRQFRGYMVQTALDITVKKTENLGPLMDKLSAAKLETGNANEWQGFMNVSYTIAEPEKIRDQMLADAIKNAREKAENMASAAGTKVGRVYAIQEGNAPSFAFPAVPMMARAMKAEMASDAAGGMAPPAGEQQLNASVTVSFELN